MKLFITLAIILTVFIGFDFLLIANKMNSFHAINGVYPEFLNAGNIFLMVVSFVGYVALATIIFKDRKDLF